jgi:benzodiazapine receptor
LGLGIFENQAGTHQIGSSDLRGPSILCLAVCSGVLAWTNAPAGVEQRRILLLFGANIFFHMLWSPFFLNLRRPDWALFEIPFLWLSIVALMLGLAPFSLASMWLLVPYLLWVTFAAFLN